MRSVGLEWQFFAGIGHSHYGWRRHRGAPGSGAERLSRCLGRGRLIDVRTPGTDIGEPFAIPFARLDIEIDSYGLADGEFDFVGIIAEACERHFTRVLAFTVFHHVFAFLPGVAGLRGAGGLAKSCDYCSFEFHQGNILLMSNLRLNDKVSHFFSPDKAHHPIFFQLLKGCTILFQLNNDKEKREFSAANIRSLRM